MRRRKPFLLNRSCRPCHATRLRGGRYAPLAASRAVVVGLRGRERHSEWRGGEGRRESLLLMMRRGTGVEMVLYLNNMLTILGVSKRSIAEDQHTQILTIIRAIRGPNPQQPTPRSYPHSPCHT